MPEENNIEDPLNYPDSEEAAPVPRTTYANHGKGFRDRATCRSLPQRSAGTIRRIDRSSQHSRAIRDDRAL